LVGLCRLPHTNQDINNCIESYHGTRKKWLNEFTRGASGRRLICLMWRLKQFIVSHYMYIEEEKFKGFIQNKELKQLWVRVLKKPVKYPMMMYYNLHLWTIHG
jgi:hypothetical protein